MEAATQTSLSEVRRETGLTQVQMATALGVSQPVISGVERGKIPISSRLQVRLARFVEEFRSPRSVGRAVSFELPRVGLLSGSDTFRFEVWQRPEASGDFACAYALPGKGVLFVCGDIAGHGMPYLPSRTFVQGWLTGYLANLSGSPRLEDLVNKLSEGLEEANLQLSGYFAVITPSVGHTVNYEAACFAIPEPLLLLGPPYKTRISANISPALPTEAQMIKITHIDALPAPWKIIAGSDGLYQRLGVGNENEGRRRIRRWMSGRQAESELSQLLEDSSIPTDDEVCAVLTYNRWDIEQRTNTASEGEKSRFVEVIKSQLDSHVDALVKNKFIIAITEAMDNACKHAYPGRPEGSLELRFRSELDCWRAEILDSGVGISNRAKHGKENGETGVRHEGMDVMRELTSHFFITPKRSNGTIVTLLLNKPNPQPHEK